MYSTPTLLTILAFLALINIVIIISLYRVNRKRKQQNEKLISGWQLQNQYMDHNVEFCKRAGEITKQVRDAIETFDSKEERRRLLRRMQPAAPLYSRREHGTGSTYCRQKRKMRAARDPVRR